MEKTIARLPDLNWPVTLFTDMIFLPAEMRVMTGTARPGLWREMAAAWTGGTPCPVLAWGGPAPDVRRSLS